MITPGAGIASVNLKMLTTASQSTKTLLNTSDCFGKINILLFNVHLMVMAQPLECLPSFETTVSKWKKQQYIDWLKSKDIAVPKKNLRAELWNMCKQERDRYPAKIVESIAKNAGHETLRLPPHHCELNPIEMVWRVLKNYVATENKDMTLKSVEELFRKRHAELKDQPEFWKKCVEKVKRIEEDYRKSDISVDIQVEKLCVELHPDSLSDSDELECLSSETSDIES